MTAGAGFCENYESDKNYTSLFYLNANMDYISQCICII